MKSLPKTENLSIRKNINRGLMKNFKQKAVMFLIFSVSVCIMACSNKSDNIDILPPEVVTVSPADASTDAPLNSEISVQFNKSVTNISASNFYISKVGVYGKLSCSITYNDTTKTATMILANSATFDADTLYVVTLDEGIISRTGVPMKPYSWVFTTGKIVDTTAPTITAATPGYDDTQVPVARDITISFSEQMQSTNFTADNIIIRSNPVDTSTTVCSTVTYNDVAKKVVINPDSNLSDNTKYYIILNQNIKDLAGNSLAGVITWSFTTDDLHDPVITKRTPDGSVSVATNAEIVIDFSESLQNTSTSIKSSGACYITRVTDNYPIDFEPVYDDDQHQLVLKPSAAFADDTQYRVGVTSLLKDRANNPVAATEWTFSTNAVVDNIIPAVDKNGTDILVDDSYPLEDQTSVPIDSNIEINFSESVSGLTNNCILERVDTGADVNCNLVIANSKKIQLQPVNSLSEGTRYRIHLTSGIKDASGNALADTQWIFTTEDNTKPQITGVTPGSLNNVDINTSVVVSFSESVVNVSAFTFVITDDSGNPVSSTVSYIDSTKTATLTPDALSYSENYTVTLSPDSSNLIRDRFGNTLNTYSWSFVTVAQPDTTAPAVTLTDPNNTDTGIALDPVVSVTFSENIKGLSSSNFVVRQGSTVIDGLFQYDPFSFTAEFSPNSTLDYGKVYTVSILAGAITDYSGNALASDYTFSFTTLEDVIKPYIISRSPDTGVTVPGNAASVVVNFSENVVIPSGAFLLKSAGSAVTATVAYDSVNKRATLTPSGTLATGSYTAELTTAVVDMSGNMLSPDNTNSVTWTFNVIAPDTTSPTVLTSSMIPSASATGVALTSNVEFTFDENVIGVDGTSVKLKKNGTDNVSAVVLYSSSSYKTVINPDSNLEYNTSYTVTLSNAVHDASGNVLSPVSWTFTTGADNIAPQVVSGSRYPANGDINVPVNSSVNLTFDEAITNWDQNSIVLNPAITGTVSISSDEKTLTFAPSVSMASEQYYTVTVSGDITDKATPTPNNFAGTTWHFTTMKVADVTSPTITGRIPGIGATDIDQQSNIRVYFSEGIKNYNSSTIYLSRSGTVVPASISYNSTDFILTLDPTDDLIGGQTYTITVKGGGATGILDLSDNPLAATSSWTFTTVTDSTAPTITSRNPVIDATEVSTKTAISVTFSESVTGVSESTFTLSGVPFSVVYDSVSRTATLTPSYNLSPNIAYTVSLTSSISDLSGNSLANTSWQFTTVSNLPQVSSSNPSNNETGVSVTKNSLSITFNTAMNPDKRWAVITEGASTAAGVMLDYGTWSNGNTTITYNVTGQFKQNTAYRLKLSGWGGTFEDTAGNIIDKTVNLTSSTTTSANITSMSATNNTFTISSASGWNTGDLVRISSTGSLPVATPALSSSTYYYVIYASATTVKLATTAANAVSGTAVDLTGAGSGTITLTLYPVGFVSFTTGADATQPSVVNVFPKNGETSVGCDIRMIMMKFSEPMNMTRSSTVTITPAVTGGTRTWLDDGRTLVYTFTSTLTSSTLYTVSIGSSGTSFQDLASNDANTYSYTFTTGSGTGSTTVLTEGFETFTSSNFTNFNNITSDSSSCDWGRLATGAYSGNGTSLTAPEGSYFAKAADWSWGYGYYGEVVANTSLNLYTAGSYILSFSMMHERVYNGSDRVAVYARTGDTNFTDSDLITDGAFNSIYRYSWSLSSDNPSWTTHYIDLSSFKGNNTVYIKIRGTSGGEHGSNALIDNLKVTRY